MTDELEVLAALDDYCARVVPHLAVMLSPDLDGMVQLLVALRRGQAQLRWAAEQLEDEIVKVMPARDTEVPGVGRVELRTGTTRKQWDKEALVAALVARIGDDPTILADPDTGELHPPAHIAETVIARFLEAATPSWKVTGLRKYRIDPDEFCETTYGRKTISTPTVTDPWETTT